MPKVSQRKTEFLVQLGPVPEEWHALRFVNVIIVVRWMDKLERLLAHASLCHSLVAHVSLCHRLLAHASLWLVTLRARHRAQGSAEREARSHESGSSCSEKGCRRYFLQKRIRCCESQGTGHDKCLAQYSKQAVHTIMLCVA